MFTPRSPSVPPLTFPPTDVPKCYFSGFDTQVRRLDEEASIEDTRNGRKEYGLGVEEGSTRRFVWYGGHNEAAWSRRSSQLVARIGYQWMSPFWAMESTPLVTHPAAGRKSIYQDLTCPSTSRPRLASHSPQIINSFYGLPTT